MKKHYLIIGKADSSIGHLAELIAGDRKYEWLLDDGYPKDNLRYMVEEDTEVIIVDEVNKKNMEFWLSCADFGVTIEKQGRDPFTINPTFVLIPEKKIKITGSIKRLFYIYKSK